LFWTWLFEGLFKAGDEIRTPDVQLGNPNVSSRKSQSDQQGTATPSAPCTNSEKTANADHLAGFVASLTPEHRQRLADLLASNNERDAS
jgi:hypothetical protein